MPDPRDPVLRPDQPDRRQELEDGGAALIDSHVADGEKPVYGEPGGPRPPRFRRGPDEAGPTSGRYGGPQDTDRAGFFGGTGDPPAAPEKDDPALEDSP
ncbi:hypothetical protein [Prosthecomicrobium pneumaticum]|nr:hypothetical protein [Prosthecomicrobium pneumaticum]